MCRFSRWNLLIPLFLLLLGLTGHAQSLTAFPGAEGAAKWTVGGRGGRVIAVTNLKDSGPGSFRSAVEASGPRTVVFRVAGTIWLKSLVRVRYPYLTIAGQTAPGDGITVAGHEFRIEAGEVIVRYLRFRLGDLVRADLDTVSITKGRNIILDHVSASWGIDEVLSVTPDARDVTVQWSIISESLFDSVHSSGDPHGKGSLLRGRNGARLSFHHNLYAHHADRAPMIQGMDPVEKDPQGVRLDFRNNVIYDWGSVADGWEAAGANRNSEAAAQVNFVNNAYLTGPGTMPGWLPISQAPYFAYRYWAFEELSTHARAYWAGNTLNGEPWKNASGNPDPTWMVSVPRSVAGSYFLPEATPFDNAELPQIAPENSTANVLAAAGASLHRDLVDQRIIRQVQTGTGDLINSQTEVGGWPLLASAAAPVDRDGDGLPDGWEKARGLNFTYRPDSARRGPDGRTWLETYHEQLLQILPLHLTITTEGHGAATASETRLALGGVSPLSVTPEPGYILDRVEQNGTPISPASLVQTPELWADTTLHFVFARPRVPMPAELAKPASLLLDPHPTLNSNLGGKLHLTINSKGIVTGHLWRGTASHSLMGEVIAREFEVPRLNVRIPIAKAEPLVLIIDLHSPNDLRGTLSQGTASATLSGWLCPWHATRQPLPAVQRLLRKVSAMNLDLATESPAALQSQARTDGWIAVTIRFSDRQVALCNTWLSSEGRWMQWSRASAGYAGTHGQGQILSDGRVAATFRRLTPAITSYGVP